MDLTSLPTWVTDVGPAAGVALTVVLMVVRGWLVPGRTVDRLVKSADALVEVHKLRADEWKGIADVLRARAEAADAQAATLTTEMSTQTQLIRSIQTEAARRRS